MIQRSGFKGSGFKEKGLKAGFIRLISSIGSIGSVKQRIKLFNQLNN